MNVDVLLFLYDFHIWRSCMITQPKKEKILHDAMIWHRFNHFIICLKEGFGIATTKLTWFSNLYGQEYVIVLVKNGKRKEDARNELRVFLDGDTDSFVSW